MNGMKSRNYSRRLLRWGEMGKGDITAGCMVKKFTNIQRNSYQCFPWVEGELSRQYQLDYTYGNGYVVNWLRSKIWNNRIKVEGSTLNKVDLWMIAKGSKVSLPEWEEYCQRAAWSQPGPWWCLHWHWCQRCLGVGSKEAPWQTPDSSHTVELNGTWWIWCAFQTMQNTWFKRAYFSVRGSVVETTLIKVILLLLNDAGAVEFVQNGHQSAAVMIIRHTASIVALSSQVCQSSILDILELDNTGRIYII